MVNRILDMQISEYTRVERVISKYLIMHKNHCKLQLQFERYRSRVQEKINKETKDKERSDWGLEDQVTQCKIHTIKAWTLMTDGHSRIYLGNVTNKSTENA